MHEIVLAVGSSPCLFFQP